MGNRKEELYSEEDLDRIHKVTNGGIHSVERKPFRFRLLFLWWIVVAALGLASYTAGKMAGVI